MLAADTGYGRGLLLGVEATGKMGVVGVTTTRQLTRVVSLTYCSAETPGGMLVGKGLLGAQTDFS